MHDPFTPSLPPSPSAPQVSLKARALMVKLVLPTLEEQAIHLSKARLAGRTKWYLERKPRIWKKMNSDFVQLLKKH